jgi:hypothetical protein
MDSGVSKTSYNYNRHGTAAVTLKAGIFMFNKKPHDATK